MNFFKWINLLTDKDSVPAVSAVDLAYVEAGEEDNKEDDHNVVEDARVGTEGTLI